MFFLEYITRVGGFLHESIRFLHINFHSKNFHELVKETCNLPLA